MTNRRAVIRQGGNSDMGMFSVGGLSSGLDTKSIISQLMSIESRGLTRLEWNKSLWESRRTGWNDLNSKLATLRTLSNALNQPSLWGAGTPGITSSDVTKLTGTSVGSPVTASYSIDVNQLAADAVWDASSPIAPAVGGVRESQGPYYSGAFTTATGASLLTSLTRSNGQTLQLTPGAVITMNATTAGGGPISDTFNVTGTTTLDDLAQWAEGHFAGANFTVNGDGTITYNSAAGANNEITSMTFSAIRAGGLPANRFNLEPASLSQFVSAPSGGATANETLTITQGVDVWNIAISQGEDLTTIVNNINATPGIGVTASDNGGLLQLTSNVAGAAGDFVATSSGTFIADVGLAQTTVGQDSDFDVDGVNYTRDKNTGITDVITDVSLDLLGLTGGTPVTLDVVGGGTVDADKIKEAITKFVNQYNQVIDYINAKTGESKVTSPKNLSEFLQGPLARDYGMTSIGFEMRRSAMDVVQGLGVGERMLADIGITTGDWSAGYDPNNTTGRLVIDEDALDAAIAADPTSVQDIFMANGATDAEDGIARRMNTLVGQWISGGRVDAAIDGASAQIDMIQDSIDRFEYRLDRKRSYYERMFASLEEMLGSLQTQNQWVSNQLGSMSAQSFSGF